MPNSNPNSYLCTAEDTFQDCGFDYMQNSQSLNDSITSLGQSIWTGLVDDFTYADQIQAVHQYLLIDWTKNTFNVLHYGLANYNDIKRIINTYVNLELADPTMIVFCGKESCNDYKRADLVKKVAEKSGSTTDLVWATLMKLYELVQKGTIKDNRLLDPRSWQKNVGTIQTPEEYKGTGPLSEVAYYGKWLLALGVVGAGVYAISQVGAVTKVFRG